MRLIFIYSDSREPPSHMVRVNTTTALRSLVTEYYEYVFYHGCTVRAQTNADRKGEWEGRVGIIARVQSFGRLHLSSLTSRAAKSTEKQRPIPFTLWRPHCVPNNQYHDVPKCKYRLYMNIECKISLYSGTE